ncbi:MAG TPA: hypothetical protein VHO70_23975 [Chitinispirillaceae bacterium]|nr:hypothetical protein [Chitinispirillaceae bacterium]
MNNHEIHALLVKLAKLYADSAWNYERAIMIIQEEEIKNELAKMHDNHIEHMERLNAYIKDFGGDWVSIDLEGEISEEMELVTDELSEEEIIRRLRNGEKTLSEKLQYLVETVEIPDLAQNLEEELEDEDVYINTLKNFL